MDYATNLQKARAVLDKIYDETKAKGLPDNNAELTEARKNYQTALNAGRTALLPPPPTAEEIAAKVAAAKVASDKAEDSQYGRYSRSIAAYNKGGGQ